MPRWINNDAARRQERAYDLAISGCSWQTVAYRTGYASASSAQYAARAHAARIGRTIPARRRSNRSTTPRIQSTAPSTATTARPPATGRRFGVEIENTLTIPEAQRALRAAGIEVGEPEHSMHRVLPVWKVVIDTSVTGHNGYGCEAVSPILSGQDGHEQVAAVMAALKAAGAGVNRTCGLHVHHEVTDLSGEALARFVENYAGRADAIDHLLAPGRRENGREGRQWCERASASELSQITTRLRAGERNVSGPKYRSISVRPFPTYGTIEIRQHQGTLNATKASAWIRFGQSLITRAETETAATLPATVFEMIQDLSASHGLAEDAAAYLMNRALTLSDQG